MKVDTKRKGHRQSMTYTLFNAGFAFVARSAVSARYITRTSGGVRTPRELLACSLFLIKIASKPADAELSDVGKDALLSVLSAIYRLKFYFPSELIAKGLNLSLA